MGSQNQAYGGTGDDDYYISGGASESLLDGGDGNDTFELMSDAGDDNHVNGGAGEDYIYSRGERSGTQVDGGADNDSIVTTGDDVIVAVGARSELQGGDGDDLLVAGGLGAQAFAKADGIVKESLKDTLQEAQGTSNGYDGEGSVLDGGGDGDGDDTVVTHLGEGGDVIVGGAGYDVLDIRGGVIENLDAGNVNFVFETQTFNEGVNVLAQKSGGGGTLWLDFREMLPSGGGINELSTLEFDLSEGGVETVRIGGTDFAMSDILDGAKTGSGYREDSEADIVDRLANARDDALAGDTFSTLSQPQVDSVATATMDYADVDKAIDPLT